MAPRQGGMLNHWSPFTRLQRALLLSFALHAILLLLVRTGPFNAGSPGFTPELRVRLEEVGERIAEHGIVAPLRRTPAAPPVPAPEVSDTSGADAAPPLTGSDESPDGTAVADQPANATPGNGIADTDSSAAGAAVFAAPPVVTAAESPVAVPATPGRAMSRVEQQAIASRIKEWSRMLENPDPTATSTTWQESGKRYTAEFVHRPASSASDLDRIDIVVTTEEDGQSLRSRLQMKRLAFSHFAQLVDQWDQNVQLHDDTIHGRFHSNSEILLGWDRRVAPRFHGEVTTTRGYKVVNGSPRSRQQLFPGGLDTRARRINMPRQFAASSVGGGGATGAADGHRQQFAADTHIVFHGDGSYGWRPLRASPAAEQRARIGASPVYLMATRGAELHVRGVVRGTVLVYSPAQIVITGNLTYANGHSPAADDYLGLVSDRDVVIAEAGVTGTGDLNIDAAIYARREFLVRNFEFGRTALLAIYGSLSAGSISASEPRYAMRVEFDRRFERIRPPDFPMTSRYDLEHWDGRWDAVPTSSRE